MSTDPRLAGRSSRLLWGGVALAMLAILAVSFLMAGRALDGAEAAAQERAERYATSGVSSQIEPEQADDDIAGQAYRNLLLRVQAEIGSDEDVVAVRIWRPDGELIFSTLARDDVETLVAPTPEIATASAGATTSIVTRTPTPQVEAGQDLFVTYVPLRFPNVPDPLGAVEIDQRYGALTSDANRLWRPIQIAAAVGLVVAVVLFAFTLRGAVGGLRSRSAQAPTRDERKLREADERANAAERAAREAEGRLVDAERRLAGVAKAEVSPEARARIDELELKLRAEQAEREQFAEEAEGLRSALTRAEAALADVRDTTASSDRERVLAAESIARAEALATEADRRAASAGALAAEEADRAKAAETLAAREAQRATSAEARATELEHRVAELEARAAELGAAARAAEPISSELDVARLDLERVRHELDAVREELAASGAGMAGLRSELEASTATATGLQGELDAVREELAASQATAAGLRGELEAARGELETSRATVTGLPDELERSEVERERLTSEIQRLESDRQRLTSELERSEAQREHLAGELERANAGPEAATAELEERLAHLESQRRDEIAELQRLQEALASTQLELMDANRKLRLAEERTDVAPPAEPVAVAEPEPRRVAPQERAPAFGEPRPRPARRPPASEPLPGVSAPEAEAEAGEGDEAAEPEIAEEGLSLRERLARAAAARHRTTQPPED